VVAQASHDPGSGDGSDTATIIAHFREQRGALIEEDATVGPGAIISQMLRLGRGHRGRWEIVTKSVPARTVVQGNPARPIATVDLPLRLDVSLKEFSKHLRPIRTEESRDAAT